LSSAEARFGFVGLRRFPNGPCKAGYATWKLSQEGGIGLARAVAVAEVERQFAALDKIVAGSPPKRRSVDEAKKLLLNAQIGLCQEIKKSCL
jgi:hypothetical protein